MYKAIIVDDEPKAAKLLELYISQTVYGFEVIHIFKDGTEAVKYLTENTDVNVVLTDIKMPYMSGVELARYINETSPDIRVVLVSAFADFAYAKQAMQYNVHDYLLKVVDPKELQDVMKSLKAELDREGSIKSRLYDEGYIPNTELTRKRFFFDIMSDKFKKTEEMQEALKKCDFTDADNRIFEILEVYLKSTENINAESIIDVHERTARSVMGIIRCTDEGHNADMTLLSDDDENYYICIVSQNDISPARIRDLVTNMFHINADVEMIFKGSLEELAESPPHIRIFDIYSGGDEYEKLGSHLNDAILSVKSFIKENISSDISRDDAAKQIHLNPAYFGRVFKKMTGMSFSEYILKQRMKNAARLLRNGADTKTASYESGYNDDKYFRLVFKKYYGVSPAEYRKTSRNGGTE